MARAPTWPLIGNPSAAAPEMRSRSDPQWARWSSAATEMLSGRPDSSTMRRNVPNSVSRSRKSETTSSTPPASLISLAMPTSSSAAAVSVGVGSPRLVLWFMVREVVNPRAPAAIPSRTMRPISPISSTVAASRWAPRSPIT